MTKKVYLSGGIAGLSYEGATDWRRIAEKQLETYGISALSPMRGKEYLAGIKRFDESGKDVYGKLNPLSTPRGVMARDFFDSTHCDAMLVNLYGATRISIGTVMEMSWAYYKRTPVICIIEDEGNPHEHIMLTGNAVDFRTPSFDEAIKIVASVLHGY